MEIGYFLFDLPFLGTSDLRQVPLASRHAVLKEQLGDKAGDHILFSEAFEASAAQLLDAACKLGLEGVMLKRAD